MVFQPALQYVARAADPGCRIDHVWNAGPRVRDLDLSGPHFIFRCSLTAASYTATAARKSMSRALKLLFLILILSVISAASFIFYRQYGKLLGSINVTRKLNNIATLGGFSIDTPERIADAAADGLQTDLLYGFPPSETDSLGQALKTHNMKVIDGALNTYLYYFECHKLKTCSTTTFPELTNV